MSVEQHLKSAIGDLHFVMANLQAQLDTANSKIQELTIENEKLKENQKPNTEE